MPVTARPFIGSSACFQGASVKVSSRRMTARLPLGVGIDALTIVKLGEQLDIEVAGRSIQVYVEIPLSEHNPILYVA